MATVYGSANYDYRFAPPGYDERLYADYRTSLNYANHAQTGVQAADSPQPPESRTAMQGCVRVVLRCVVPVTAVVFLVLAFRSIHPVNEDLPHHHAPQNSSNHTGNHSHHPPPVPPRTHSKLAALKADDDDEPSGQLFDMGEIHTNSFLLRWHSDISAPSSSVFAFALTVSELGGSPKPVVPFETGLVWRENTTVAGVAACCGNSSWSLKAGHSYEYEVQEFLANGARSSKLEKLGTARGKFSTSATLPTPKDEARAAAFGPAVTRVFNDTRDSIRARVRADGFFGESPYAHEYGALEFIRTLGAATAAFLELGNDDLAKSILDLVLSLHAETRPGEPGYAFPVHTINPQTSNYSHGSRNYTLEAGNEQVDGVFHLIVAWARYAALHPEDTRFFSDYYPMMKRWTLRYRTPFPSERTAMFTNPATPLFNSSLGLILNPDLEHSRDDHYWVCYDLIANVFAEEGLRLMTAAAHRADDSQGAAAFKAFRLLLQDGLERSLSYADGSSDNKNIYAELRPLGPGSITPEDPNTPLEYVWGMSWVNLAPIPAYAAQFTARNETGPGRNTALDIERMDATLLAYRRLGFFVWEPVSSSDARRGAEIALTHLNASTHGQPFFKPAPGEALQVQEAAIGKGFGWELLYAAHRGDWQRVVALERFVGDWTYAIGQPKKFFFGESYWYNRYLDSPSGHTSSYESDPGNGEQVCWYVFGQAVVRRMLAAHANGHP